jgi:probable HAF family extracellular repeat protein
MKSHPFVQYALSLPAFLLIATPLNAQQLPSIYSKATPQVRYGIIDLGTLGGKMTQGYGINGAGHIGAGSTRPDGTLHAALWTQAEGLKDLGTLGGPNSVADTPNAQDEIPIFSEAAKTDPYGENFCLFGTKHLCLGAVWNDGKLTRLDTLGGNNAAAWAVNDLGIVAGFSETREKDPTCAKSLTSQVFRYEAVEWNPEGKIRALRPLAGDTVSFAFAINSRGQVVGGSGLCSNTALPPGPNAPHAVLWEPDGQPIDLGSLAGPGKEPNVADSINDEGEVVGGSMAKDGTIHTFFWTRTIGMIDLGAFPNAAVTVAGCCNTNNNVGQIVGFAIDGTTFQSRAFLWQNWTFTDLNKLKLSRYSDWDLQNASSINDAGEITGYGAIGGNTHGFLAIPCDNAHANSEACQE